MNTPDPRNRDRNLRIVRRATTGVVAAGVLGSIGVAGVVALSNGTNATQAGSTGSTGSTSAAQSRPAPASGDSFSHWSDGERGNDDGAQVQPPSVQPGLGGTSHGSTSGS